MTSDEAAARCDDPVWLMVLALATRGAYSVLGSTVSG